MRTIVKILAGASGLAALAAAAPAAAQYYGSTYDNGYYGNNNSYYGSGYSADPSSAYGYNSYGYNGYAMNTAAAAQQCTAAVQQRLYNRTGLAGILGSLVGVNVGSGQVLSITAETPTNYGVRVDGLASSGRTAYNNYSPYGVGAYGALGYNYAQQADLSFRCRTDAYGNVQSVKLYRRY
jgi:hypothetical protein